MKDFLLKRGIGSEGNASRCNRTNMDSLIKAADIEGTAGSTIGASAAREGSVKAAPSEESMVWGPVSDGVGTVKDNLREEKC